jgi:DNA-binding MarR family transcriptional regulator
MEENITKKKSAIANSRVGIIDKQSGEVLDEGDLIFVPKKLRIKGFFMAMQDGFEFIAKQKLNAESLNVMLFILSKIDYENSINVSAKTISEEMKMDLSNVYRAMRCLKKAGVLDEPASKFIRISIDLAWKGKVANLKREQNVQTKKSLRRVDATPEGAANKSVA